MAHAGHNPVCFRWKRLTKNKAVASKVQFNDGDIAKWRKKVEMASELALSEVFPSQKTASKRRNSQAVMLQNIEQLHDHDEAYSEAQDLLNNWMSRKLHLELEVEEDKDTVITRETDSLFAPPSPFRQHSNFDDLYSHLDQEAEDCAVHNVLQELMELEMVDSGVAEDLMSDMERKKTRKNNALVPMEMRHQLVRDSQAQRDAEHLKQQERKFLKEVKEKAQRRERQEQRRRRQEERQQEELLQQEVVQLRRKMVEQRNLEQRARLMKRESQNKKTLILASPPPDLVPTVPKMQQVQEQQKREELSRLHVVQSKVHMLNLRILQNHFSKWYSTALERRVQMGNAAALHDWRSQLRVWREWRSLVWAGRKEREARSTEEELRSENRRCQVALENDRWRLLRRCLHAWRILVQAEQNRQDLFNQQEETQHKIAALINAAKSGKLGASNTVPSAPYPSLPTTTVPPETTSTQSQGVDGVPQRFGRKEERCKEQQGIVAEQCQHLREQRRQLLLEEQRLLKHQRKEQGMVGKKQQSQSTPRPCPDPEELPEGPRCVQQVAMVVHSAPETSLQPRPSSLVTAMEERARQRAERKRELKEMKRRKEEERQTLMRVEEEQRQQERNEEKKREAEMRREKRRQLREREIERQHKAEQEKQMFDKAVEHHHRALLLHHGLIPLKRLLKKSHTQNQLAQAQYRASLQRRFLLIWLQAAGKSVAEKEARATHMYQHILLRRILHFWLKMKEYAVVQKMQAEQFCQTRILHRTLMSLQDHVANERFAAWDKERQAKEHWLSISCTPSCHRTPKHNGSTSMLHSWQGA
ncbi:coiled-coil domain-containing protein 191 isoform X2 [Conger conger]|uniref:coiled-coil domain-containing protein 191 isoform X2 n=1 Tax=Conger conger TaxID=82655 RepID=UPI002A5AEBFF|nr:coiled-coil domain-containing protein 191 isoform X2 [Conger conger]